MYLHSVVGLIVVERQGQASDMQSLLGLLSAETASDPSETGGWGVGEWGVGREGIHFAPGRMTHHLHLQRM